MWSCSISQWWPKYLNQIYSLLLLAIEYSRVNSFLLIFFSFKCTLPTSNFFLFDLILIWQQVFITKWHRNKTNKSDWDNRLQNIRKVDQKSSQSETEKTKKQILPEIEMVDCNIWGKVTRNTGWFPWHSYIEARGWNRPYCQHETGSGILFGITKAHNKQSPKIKEGLVSTISLFSIRNLEWFYRY